MSNYGNEPIFLVALNIEASEEDRWNEWYERVHVPEVVSVSKDILSATRYRMLEGNLGFRYLAIYRFGTRLGLESFMQSSALAEMSARYTAEWGDVSGRGRGAWSPISHLVPER